MIRRILATFRKSRTAPAAPAAATIVAYGRNGYDTLRTDGRDPRWVAQQARNIEAGLAR